MHHSSETTTPTQGSVLFGTVNGAVGEQWLAVYESVWARWYNTVDMLHTVDLICGYSQFANARYKEAVSPKMCGEIKLSTLEYQSPKQTLHNISQSH